MSKWVSVADGRLPGLHIDEFKVKLNNFLGVVVHRAWVVGRDGEVRLALLDRENHEVQWKEVTAWRLL